MGADVAARTVRQRTREQAVVDSAGALGEAGARVAREALSATHFVQVVARIASSVFITAWTRVPGILDLPAFV